jgi:hypothetical protein
MNVLCFVIGPGTHLLYPVKQGMRNITFNQELFNMLASDKNTNIIFVTGIILKYHECNKISDELRRKNNFKELSTFLEADSFSANELTCLL